MILDYDLNGYKINFEKFYYLFNSLFLGILNIQMGIQVYRVQSYFDRIKLFINLIYQVIQLYFLYVMFKILIKMQKYSDMEVLKMFCIQFCVFFCLFIFDNMIEFN